MIPQLLPSVTQMLIILAVVLVLFGGGKLAGLGKASGQAIREFKEEISAGNPPDDQAALSDAKESPADSPSTK